jgi:hypothetical protein
MVAWDHVTRDDVVRAIQEYDRLGPEGFFSEHDFAPATTYSMSWSGTNAVTRRKQSWAQLMSSPRASALAPVISRAERPALSGCSES